MRHITTRRRTIYALGTVLAIAGLTACAKASSPTQAATAAPSTFHAVSQQSGAPITVWVDSTRLPGVQAYQKSHPDVKLNIVTYSGDPVDSSYLQAKIELYTRAGSGWPDVVFSQQYNEITWS